jgi:hypothetical protein
MRVTDRQRRMLDAAGDCLIANEFAIDTDRELFFRQSVIVTLCLHPSKTDGIGICATIGAINLAPIHIREIAEIAPTIRVLALGTAVYLIESIAA